MVDDVAKALCDAAGRSAREDRVLPECPVCERKDGVLVCTMWPTFRIEAQAAIVAAHKWQREHRRWPNWIKG